MDQRRQWICWVSGWERGGNKTIIEKYDEKRLSQPKAIVTPLKKGSWVVRVERTYYIIEDEKILLNIFGDSRLAWELRYDIIDVLSIPSLPPDAGREETLILAEFEKIERRAERQLRALRELKTKIKACY